MSPARAVARPRTPGGRPIMDPASWRTAREPGTPEAPIMSSASRGTAYEPGISGSRPVMSSASRGAVRGPGAPGAT